MLPCSRSGIASLCSMEVCPRHPVLHPKDEQGQQGDGDGKHHVENRGRWTS